MRHSGSPVASVWYSASLMCLTPCCWLLAERCIFTRVFLIQDAVCRLSLKVERHVAPLWIHPVDFFQEGDKVVKKVGGVFAFKVKDGPNGREATWVVDVKNGKGSVSNDPGMCLNGTSKTLQSGTTCFGLLSSFIWNLDKLLFVHA